MAGKAKQKLVHVSNHALFRWMERTGVVDVEALRSMLESSLERAVLANLAMGDGECLVLSAGLVYVVRQGVVVTVTEDDGRHQHARHLAHRSRGQ